MNNTNELRLYRIETTYINYLKQYDNKVIDNSKNGVFRPYVGVVLEINSFKYYIPLSSPKPKHLSMRESLSFIKLQDGNELKAVLNINNMIPVIDSQIVLLDIRKEQQPYRDLLNKEYQLIKRKRAEIIRKASILYRGVTERKDQKLIEMSCDFTLLEQKCYNFKQL